MALLQCHECKKEVSSEAKSCPNCGAKVKKPMSKFTKVAGSIILVIFAISFITTLFTTNTKNVNIPAGPDSMDAYIMATKFVKLGLKNPHTANFATHNSSAIKNTADIWEVSSFVDSKNDFGGEIRMKYYCKLKHVGNRNFKLVDIKMARE